MPNKCNHQSNGLLGPGTESEPSDFCIPETM